MATEEPPYNVIQKDRDIEIREYAERVVAQVTVKAESRGDASSKAFRTLFNYISGENVPTQEIPMTAPVTQERINAEGEKIPMTAPVTQSQDGQSAQNQNGEWTIRFFMPDDMTIEEAPAPKNKGITLKALPRSKLAVIRFSGRTTDENFEEHKNKLKDYLDQNDLSYAPSPTYAVYNAPFTPWFMRRNEVMFLLN